MASKMLHIMRGLQARKVQLTVRYLSDDDMLLDGCKDAWQSARPTKLLEFAPFSVSCLDFDMISSADHSPPGLDLVAHARTVLEGLNDLGVSGLALSPSGQDADCLIRGFFCGHRHLANVRAMVDAYWNDDEVGVRSWPGFTKNVRDMLITVLSAIVAPTSEVSDSCVICVVNPSLEASSSEALAGASVYAVHTNKLFDGDFLGAVSLVLDGRHYHVFVPDKDVCVAHQVDHEDVMKHGGAFPPIVCLPIVAANEWWGAVTKGGQDIEVSRVEGVGAVVLPVVPEPPTPTKGSLGGGTSGSCAMNFALALGSAVPGPRASGLCLSPAVTTSVVHRGLPAVCAAGGVLPVRLPSRRSPRSTTTTPVDAGGFIRSKGPCPSRVPAGLEAHSGMDISSGRYSLLHDEDAIHEVAVSEDLRASKAVRMGTERARIASVDRGSEDFHSGGDCTSGSGGSSQRRGGTCTKKRKRKPSAASPRKVIDLSMSQADDGVACGRAAIDLSMSQPEEGVDVSLLTSGCELFAELYVDMCLGDIFESDDLPGCDDEGDVDDRHRCGGIDDIVVGTVDVEPRCDDVEPRCDDVEVMCDDVEPRCDDVGAHCLADVFVDSSGSGGHQHESGSNVVVDVGSGFMESGNVDVVSVALLEGCVGVDVRGLNADDIWSDASERSVEINMGTGVLQSG
eukprot:gene6936-biopygen12395